MWRLISPPTSLPLPLHFSTSLLRLPPPLSSHATHQLPLSSPPSPLPQPISSQPPHPPSHTGLLFEGVVPAHGAPKLRLDSWLASQLPDVSRARVQSSIRVGLAQVNGQTVSKASYTVRSGDHVKCTISALIPLKAEPEGITLDIVYEDDHVLVVNKPAHMVTHPAPGNLHGTLVNALLHHCGLPLNGCVSQSSDGAISSSVDGISPFSRTDIEDFEEDLDSVEAGIFTSNPGASPLVRPGIVHRLDKGTSGLLVVAKNEYAHGHLSEQFKSRTVKRSYVSLTCGLPPSQEGRVDVAIGRDINNRIRMAAVSNPNVGRRARTAASRYRIIEVLAHGGSALVEWRLETGRTHQIRVHAQHLGNPLLGDEVYGGTKGAALARLLPKLPSSFHGTARQLISQLQRPCLHASTLGFIHPQTGQELSFACSLPQDFEMVWLQLQKFGAS